MNLVAVAMLAVSVKDTILLLWCLISWSRDALLTPAGNNSKLQINARMSDYNKHLT